MPSCKSDRCGNRLAGKHVRTVELTVDDIVSCFQFGWAITSTWRPSSSKKPFSLAITIGAQSVSLMKPNFSSSFSVQHLCLGERGQTSKSDHGSDTKYFFISLCRSVVVATGRAA